MNNYRAESALLGALLIGAETLAPDTLSPDDFGDARHKAIWSSVESLLKGGKPPYRENVLADLAAHSLTAEAGGEEYLVILEQSAPLQADVEHLVTLLREASFKRSLQRVSDEIRAISNNPALSLAEAARQAEESLVRASRNLPADDLIPLAEYLPQYAEEMRRASAGAIRIPTGTSIDEVVDLEKKQLVYVAGRPGMGKTSFLLYLVRQWKERKVAFFSLEMPKHKIVSRLVSAITSTPVRDFYRSNIAPAEQQLLSDALTALQEYTLYITDRRNFTTRAIAEASRRMKAQGGLDVIMIDYLGLITPSLRSDNVNQQIADVSRSLLHLSGELDVLVLCAVQLNRNLTQRQDKRPTMADLRDSGALEQDAHCILSPYRPIEYDKQAPDDAVELLILKNRDGRTGTVHGTANLALNRWEFASPKF